MTVTTTENFTAFIADGIETIFTFSFQTQEESDIVVYFDGVLISAGFTVALNDDQDSTPGGTVTFDVPPANGTEVVIYREVPNTQQTDYQEYGPFPAESHETALDKLTMICQQLQEQFNRLSLPPPGLPDAGIFPVGALMIGFNPNGILIGTWVQLAEGTFLMNTVDAAEPSGGSNDAVLVAHNHDIDHGHGVTDPGHNHTLKGQQPVAGGSTQSNIMATTGVGFTSGNAVTNLTVDNHTGNSSTDGVSATGANRPLFKGVAIWERTA